MAERAAQVSADWHHTSVTAPVGCQHSVSEREEQKHNVYVKQINKTSLIDQVTFCV